MTAKLELSFELVVLGVKQLVENNCGDHEPVEEVAMIGGHPQDVVLLCVESELAFWGLDLRKGAGTVSLSAFLLPQVIDPSAAGDEIREVVVMLDQVLADLRQLRREQMSVGSEFSLGRDFEACLRFGARNTEAGDHARAFVARHTLRLSVRVDQD